jgi:hypothetical protein
VFGSTMLETIMGMVFVFLTMSLAVTAAVELLASIFRWRSKDLERGLGRLLGQVAAGEPSFVNRFKRHALIQSIVPQSGRFPSYLSSRTFATVLLDLAKVQSDASAGATSAADLRAAVSRNGELPDHLKEVLSALLGQVERGMSREASAALDLQRSVESWFDSAMDRVGGGYKRRASYASFGLAAVLSVGLNLDSIEMVEALSRDTTLRQGIAAQAAQFAQRAPAAAAPTAAPPPDGSGAAPETERSYATFVRAMRHIDDLGLPVGWSRQGDAFKKLKGSWAYVGWGLGKLLGLLLTALAASLGAPLWFDVLSKFVSIRASGKIPEDPAPSPVTVPSADARKE